MKRLTVSALLTWLALGTAAAQSSRLEDDARALPAASRDSVLAARARRQPDELRETVRRLLTKASIAASDSSTVDALERAQQLAAAYAVAWRDSFFIRQVARFKALSSADRRAKIAADSARRTGNTALSTKGPAAAMRWWRESLRGFQLLSDSVGIAAALGNLGAGFYELQRLDSAEEYLSHSRDLAEAVGDYRTLGNAIGLLASVSKDRGDIARAAALYESASSIRERSGDRRGLAADRNNLGLLAQERGDWREARRQFDAALAANRADGHDDAAATDLVNLGNVAGLQGDYADARAFYEEARRIYHESQSRVDEAFVLHNMGTLDVRRGDYRPAIHALAAAASIYHSTGPAFEEIAVRRDLVSARAAVGDLQGARSELEIATSLTSKLPVDGGIGLRAQLALAAADLDLQFNDLAAAAHDYARADGLSRKAHHADLRAAALAGRATILLLGDDYSGARDALRRALAMHSLAGDERAVASIGLLLAYAEDGAGDGIAARRSAGEALATLVRLGDVVGEASALGTLGDLALHAANSIEADSLYRQALACLTGRSAPHVAWQLHAGLARALATRRESEAAITQYHLAIEEIERTAFALSADERRSAYRADKWNVYTELSLLEQSRGRSAEAFAVSERLRARQMLDLLARGRVDVPSSPSAELASREQDARRHIALLERELELGPERDSSATANRVASGREAPLHEELAAAQSRYAELLVRIQESDTSYGRLVRGEAALPAAVMRALGPDDALLEYLVGDTTTLVFVVTSDSVASVRLASGREALTALVDFARGTLTRKKALSPSSAWRLPFRRLYDRLVAPIEERGLLAGKRRLLIAPHAELHYLPFAALVRHGGDLLIDRYSLEYVPSASVWLRLRDRPDRTTSGTVLAMAPRVDALPASRDEVNGIARLFGARARVLLGTAASEEAFRSLAPEADIVHLATDGVLNKENPLFSYVQLAAGGGGDGRLEVHEVFGVPLRARLIVLSACQTGLGSGAFADVPPGDDWIGLVRTFLFAGASNVLATLWAVDDRSTAQLMQRFYGAVADKRSLSAALADAQRAMAHEPERAHPFYWASLALFAGQ